MYTKSRGATIARGEGCRFEDFPPLRSFPVPKPAEGEEEGMKSRAGVRPRVWVTYGLDRTGRLPRGNDTFPLAFGYVALLAAEGVGGRDGLPRASPTTFPSL